MARRKRIWPSNVWIEQHSHYEGNECLIWPFGRDAFGYARVGWGGKKSRFAHRIMCELRNGPPVAPRNFTAHSCGRGRDGCVNPSHLRWATALENEADKVAHGTVSSGARNSRTKLTPEQVIEIRNAGGMHKDLAAQYDIDQSCISRIKARKEWKHVAETQNSPASGVTGAGLKTILLTRGIMVGVICWRRR